MKKLLLAFCLVAISFATSYSQTVRDFNFGSDMDSLLQLHPKGFAMYFTALWCAPCTKHEKIVSDYFHQKDTTTNFYVVYERTYFSKDNAEKILGHYFTDNINFKVPDSFYAAAKGPINIKINPQKKAIKNIRQILSPLSIKKGKLEDFYFGQLIYVTAKKELCLLKVQPGTGLTDDMLKEFMKDI